MTDHLDLWTSALLVKSTAGRGKNGRLEAYGIKKLRALILELAVRGKLVPQDARDKPASALLMQIAHDKAKVIKDGNKDGNKDGKIRKPSGLSEIKDFEQRFELPVGWQWARLGEILQRISNGFSGKQNKNGLGVPLSRIETISNSVVDMEKVGYSPELDTEKLEYYRLQAGDILLSHINSDYHVGKTALVPENIVLYHGVNLLLLRVMSGVNPRYVDLVLNAHRLSGYFIKIAQHAIGQASINQQKVVEVALALPPEGEQCRIVAKVDELMALCDQLEQQQGRGIEAHQTLVETLLGTLTNVASAQEFAAAWNHIAEHFDTLFTTEHSIDQLKQAILQLAVMGKLVSQNGSDESAKKLVERKSSVDEENKPFKIPDSWVWARVEEIAQTRLGKMLDKAKNKGKPFRYLRNINVRWFDFDLSDVKEMRFEEAEREEFSLRRGDVLICEGGYPGRAAVWDEREEDIYFQKAIHRVRFENGINPNYFVLVLRNSADSGRLSTYFTGAGIQHFTGKGLMSFSVPLPPLAEQQRIVVKVDELMALCDALKARLTEAQTTQIRLADAIVERAVAAEAH